MKTPGSLRGLYEDQLGLHKIMHEKVDSILRLAIPSIWHYESRVKQLESYVQKVETGQVDPHAVEDFFACTLVVPTLTDLAEAESRVARLFVVHRRKPESATVAQAGPFSFPFDHVRIYATLRVPLGIDDGPLYQREFEIQTKTYLQHAWSIATHDLTYKASDVSWGTERVAAQVKASLEAAEVSIVQAKDLAASNNLLLTRIDESTAALVQTVQILNRKFARDELPQDVKRLGQNCLALLHACGLEAVALESILTRGKAKNRGAHPQNLSPYGVVFEYACILHPGKVRRALSRTRGKMILVPNEVDTETLLGVAVGPNARRVHSQLL